LFSSSADHGGSFFLQNFGRYLPDCIEPQPRRT
jgi:hypothetical protein